MKVSVRVSVTYYYTIEIPDDTPAEDVVERVDTEDPVYEGISRMLHNDPIVTDYDAYVSTIINDETGEYLYEY